MSAIPAPIRVRPVSLHRRGGTAAPSTDVHAEQREPRRGYTRAQLVDQIMSHNATAPEAFLNDFSERELENYLNHLVHALLPRGRDAVWERPGDAPAIWWSRRVA